MNFIDTLICEIDSGLRTVFAKPHADRPLPRPMRDGSRDCAELDESARRESVRLMRINHAGEVCAQALYQGQAFAARGPKIRELLLSSAQEERDHLAWCGTRLDSLRGRTSAFSPLFYAGSFGIGVATGLMGDKWSLGFLVETERQVEAHLDEHLEKIADEDTESRAILAQMRDDEIRHGQAGQAHGSRELPEPIKAAMRAFSKVMTKTTYWV